MQENEATPNRHDSFACRCCVCYVRIYEECLSDSDIYMFAMYWLPLRYAFCAMLPMGFRLIWIVFLPQLVVTLDSLCLPCHELARLRVQNITAHSGESAECALEYMYTSRRVTPCSSRPQYSREELLSMASCSLHPFVLSSIRDLGIGRRLPKIPSHWAGRRKKEKDTCSVWSWRPRSATGTGKWWWRSNSVGFLPT